MVKSWRWSFSDADAAPPGLGAPAGEAAVQEKPEDAQRPSLVPRAWFGTATTPLPDPAEGEEEDPDDEELDETPEDVVAMLGFDPKDGDEDDLADDEDGDDPDEPLDDRAGTTDAGFSEADHPRDAVGQFKFAGGGGSNTGWSEATAEKHASYAASLAGLTGDEGEMHRAAVGLRESEAREALDKEAKGKAGAFAKVLPVKVLPGAGETARKQYNAFLTSAKADVAGGSGKPAKAKRPVPSVTPASPPAAVPAMKLADQPHRSAEQVGRMSDDEFRSSYGVHVAATDSLKASEHAGAHVTAMRSAVAAIPKSHREHLGANVHLEGVDKIDVHGVDATGAAGVGSAGGVYQGHAAPKGSFYGGAIQIAANMRVGGELRRAANVSSSTTHEVGHALDYSLGLASGSAAFRNSIPAAGSRGTAEEEGRGRYFHLNDREMWAETYSVLHDPSAETHFGGMTKERAHEVYAGPIAAMRKILGAKGLA